jgi:hypothetical protein
MHLPRALPDLFLKGRSNLPNRSRRADVRNRVREFRVIERVGRQRPKLQAAGLVQAELWFSRFHVCNTSTRSSRSTSPDAKTTGEDGFASRCGCPSGEGRDQIHPAGLSVPGRGSTTRQIVPTTPAECAAWSNEPWTHSQVRWRKSEYTRAAFFHRASEPSQSLAQRSRPFPEMGTIATHGTANPRLSGGRWSVLRYF